MTLEVGVTKTHCRVTLKLNLGRLFSASSKPNLSFRPLFQDPISLLIPESKFFYRRQKPYGSVCIANG